MEGLVEAHRERARSLDRRLERLEHSLVAERARHARLLALLVNGGVSARQMCGDSIPAGMPKTLQAPRTPEAPIGPQRVLRRVGSHGLPGTRALPQCRFLCVPQ